MNKVYTFSNLGHYGALGNQLWQIAGVMGEADKVKAQIYFPDWEYFPYFSLPENLFEQKQGEHVDFWPGYLQDLNHFRHIETVIKDVFEPSEYSRYLVEENFPWDKSGDRIVGVHVRRANNVYLPEHHPVCSLDYFEQALDAIIYDDILVCSDDIEWCKKQSLFKNAAFGMGTPKNTDVMRLTDAHPLTNVEAVIDLFMLSLCDSQIISNSSFSWWSAYLGEGEFVVRPSQWYGPALQHIDTSTMFPQEWLSI